jgi:flagellar hook assembly protein FlgD
MNFPDLSSGGVNLPQIQGPSLNESRAVKPADQKDQLADKTVFLQLLVNQIKYQNPLEPADSIQYVTQLNQFSATEQLVEIRKLLEEVPVSMPESAERNF